jgi:hypothetical protein
MLPARHAAADDFIVLPVKVSLPVQVVTGNQIVKRTLKEKDLVNLALGRSLATKVDKNTEILAVAVSADDEVGAVIVFDPSQNGLAQITTTVGEPTSYDFEGAFLASGGQGHGIGIGTLVETTLGNPTQNALHATSLWGAAAGKSSATRKASVKGIVAGRLRFTVTENGQTRTLAGFIIGGKIKVAGNFIGMYSDGSSGGCGDGMLQPGLGEECEFNNQTACPGHCAECMCRVCGNNREDPGEICDGTDNTRCDALTPPVPCKPDCSGCAVCGDGVISPNEECDQAEDEPCPGMCLFPECLCRCDSDDPEACPGTECCSDGGRCAEVTIPNAPNAPFTTQSCTSGTVPGGMCGGLVTSGEQCPNQQAGMFFACHTCGGKFVHNTCATGMQSCVLDDVGPLP